MAWIGAIDAVDHTGSFLDLHLPHQSRSRRQFEESDEQCGCLWKNKRKVKDKSEKERIKQFSIWFEEVDNERQRSYVQRRFDRASEREKKRQKIKCFRRLFIPTAFLWLVGFCIIMASTVRSLGEGTIFWTKREVFHIIGPVTLALGLIMLMVTEGLISNYQIKQKKLESRLLTSEIDIDVGLNGKNQRLPALTPGQKTLKAISGKVAKYSQEEYTNKQPEITNSENSEQSLKQRLENSWFDTQNYKTNAIYFGSRDADKIPISITVTDYDNDNPELHLPTEYEELLSAHGRDIRSNLADDDHVNTF